MTMGTNCELNWLSTSILLDLPGVHLGFALSSFGDSTIANQREIHFPRAVTVGLLGRLPSHRALSFIKLITFFPVTHSSKAQALEATVNHILIIYRAMPCFIFNPFSRESFPTVWIIQHFVSTPHILSLHFQVIKKKNLKLFMKFPTLQVQVRNA